MGRNYKIFESTFDKYVNFESIFENFVISKEKMSLLDEETILISDLCKIFDSKIES